MSARKPQDQSFRTSEDRAMLVQRLLQERKQTSQKSERNNAYSDPLACLHSKRQPEPLISPAMQQTQESDTVATREEWSAPDYREPD